MKRSITPKNSATNLRKAGLRTHVDGILISPLGLSMHVNDDPPCSICLGPRGTPVGLVIDPRTRSDSSNSTQLIDEFLGAAPFLLPGNRVISIPELDQHDQEVGNIEIDYATTSVVAVSMMLPGLQQALLLRDEDSSWFQLTGTDLFGFDHLGNAHPSTRHSPCDADMVFSWLERCCIFASRVWPELLSAYPALRSFNTLAIENKILDRDGWHPKHGQENGFAYRGCSAIPVKAKEQELLSDVESVARKLIGNGPAIFRYLANNPKGVSFGEFMCASNPVTGLRLTTSEQPANIANMLKRLSREQLKQHTYEITAKPQANLIKLRKIGR